MLKFSTSNKTKIQEISDVYNIDFIDGVDIDEIDSQDLVEVIKYKTFDMYQMIKRDGIVVEDTILEINGNPVNDIKFRLKEIEADIERYIGLPVSMKVSVGTVINNKLYIFTNKLDGIIVNKSKDGFGFDPYFGISYNGKVISLSELKERGLKNKFSPRIDVVGRMLNWINNKGEYPDHIFNLSSINKWNGKYQK